MVIMVLFDVDHDGGLGNTVDGDYGVGSKC